MKYSAAHKHGVLIRWDHARRVAFKAGIRQMTCDRLFLRVLRGEGTPIAHSGLYRWRALFRDLGLEGLHDFRRTGPRIDRSDDPFMNEAIRLRKQSAANPLSMLECYRLALHAAERNGWKVYSFKTTQRHLSKCGLGWRKGHSGRPPNAVRQGFKAH